MYLEAVPRLHLPYSCRLVATRGQYLGPLGVEANLHTRNTHGTHTEERRKNGKEEWKEEYGREEYGENMAREKKHELMHSTNGA